MTRYSLGLVLLLPLVHLFAGTAAVGAPARSLRGCAASDGASLGEKVGNNSNDLYSSDDSSGFMQGDDCNLPVTRDAVESVHARLPALSSSFIARGPFLQAVSATSVTVVWQPMLVRACGSTQARVYVGLAPHAFTHVYEGIIDYSGGQLDAVVHVTGLTPLTNYYYAVCSDDACARDAYDQEAGNPTPSSSMTFTTTGTGDGQAPSPQAR